VISQLTPQESNRNRNDSKGVIRDLGLVEPETILFEKGLAEILGCCTQTIKRCVDRGELPPSVRMNGKPCWTARSIVEHIEERLRAAKREAESEAARLARMRI